MRFLFLIHDDAEAVAGMSSDERRAIVDQHLAYGSMLRERGAYVLGEALAGTETAAVVRPGERPLVTDGPFAETKEAVGGFYVVECVSRTRRSSSPASFQGVPASPSRCSRSPRSDDSVTANPSFSSADLLLVRRRALCARRRRDAFG